MRILIACVGISLVIIGLSFATQDPYSYGRPYSTEAEIDDYYDDLKTAAEELKTAWGEWRWDVPPELPESHAQDAYVDYEDAMDTWYEAIESDLDSLYGDIDATEDALINQDISQEEHDTIMDELEAAEDLYGYYIGNTGTTTTDCVFTSITCKSWGNHTFGAKGGLTVADTWGAALLGLPDQDCDPKVVMFDTTDLECEYPCNYQADDLMLFVLPIARDQHKDAIEEHAQGRFYMDTYGVPTGGGY